MSSWATSGVDLHLAVGRAGARGLRASLAEALRDAVRTRRLAPGTLLPSSRALAADLGIARNTVADVYAELVAEGWLTARQGSGTRVARRAEPPHPAPGASPAPAVAARGAVARGAVARGTVAPRGAADLEPAPATAPAHDLRTGRPAFSSFPRAAWLSSARRALNTASGAAFGYGEPGGGAELRRALADYLARARGVRTDPERIVVCSGFTGGLRLLSPLLGHSPGGARSSESPGVGAVGAAPVAVEDHGLWIHRDVLSRAGLRTVPLPVDDQGARVAELPGTGARAVLLTPAHQFPTGAALLPERRGAVVDWARTTDGLVLEDDYDGEFRYDRQPVGALQNLDPERVVYMGTASKSLAPGLRLGWMVLPDALVDAVLAANGTLRTSTLDQLTLTDFLESGAYDRHVRAMRQRYRRRRDQLVTVLAERAPQVRVTGIAAGLHAVLELPPGTEERVVREAARAGLELEGLGRFRHPDAGPAPAPTSAPAAARPRDALVVGYGAPADHAFTATLDALCRTLVTALTPRAA